MVTYSHRYCVHDYNQHKLNVQLIHKKSIFINLVNQ